MNVWVYPGSFDPVTVGHIDMIERGAKLCSKLYVAVTDNLSKKHVYTIDERIDFIKRSIRHVPNVVVESFSTLLVDYASSVGADAILRGVRNQTDFEYEGNLAHINWKLNNKVDTIFINSRAEMQCISSSFVKEILKYKGDVTNLVSEEIKQDIIDIYVRRNK